MEQRNEPTTAEIVKALRCNPEDSCLGCPYCLIVSWCQEDGTADIDCNDKVLYYDAAARLEQLERENAELRKAARWSPEAFFPVMLQKDVTISALTTRAEKAEAERDAANRIWREWYDNEGYGECALCQMVPTTCGNLPEGKTRINGCPCFSINAEFVRKHFFNRYGFKNYLSAPQRPTK